MTWTWLGIVTLAFVALAFLVGFRRGFVREAAATFIVVLSIVVVWLINPYVNEFMRENTPVYEMVQEGCQQFIGAQSEKGTALDKQEQSSLVEGLKLPQSLKEGILENNTADAYRLLAVNNFTDYVVNYLATTVVNGLSFLISFLLANILIRTVIWGLDLLAKLPIINGANKLAGGLLGGGKCIVFVWVAMLLFTVFCETDFGKAGLELIEKDSVLKALYDYNILAEFFTSIFYS